MKINIFNYTDPVRFLQDVVSAHKERNPRYSFRLLAKLAGITSSGYLPMVLAGKRKITHALATRLSKGLKLAERETEYFETLAAFTQATQGAQRDQYYERLRALRPANKATKLAEDQYSLFSKPYYVVVHQMILLPDFCEDPQWIAARAYPGMTVQEAREAVAALLRLKLIKRGAAGNLVHNNESLATEPEIPSDAVFQYHYGLFSAAKHALVKIPGNLRDITSVAIPISLRKLPELKKRIAGFREETVDWLNSSPTESGEVYYLNIQLFPATFKRR